MQLVLPLLPTVSALRPILNPGLAPSLLTQRCFLGRVPDPTGLCATALEGVLEWHVCQLAEPLVWTPCGAPGVSWRGAMFYTRDTIPHATFVFMFSPATPTSGHELKHALASDRRVQPCPLRLYTSQPFTSIESILVDDPVRYSSDASSAFTPRQTSSFVRSLCVVKTTSSPTVRSTNLLKQLSSHTMRRQDSTSREYRLLGEGLGGTFTFPPAPVSLSTSSVVGGSEPLPCCGHRDAGPPQPTAIGTRACLTCVGVYFQIDETRTYPSSPSPPPDRAFRPRASRT